MNRHFWIVLGAIALIAGCIGAEPEQMPPEMKAQLEAQALADQAQPIEAEPAPVDQPAPQPEKMEEAKAGVGVKGSRYGGGVITEPISVYFRAGQAIVFDIQIPHGMKTFNAINNRNPRDWDEFEREILKPAHIKLPELPEGKEYHYDPKEGKLMVKTAQ